MGLMEWAVVIGVGVVLVAVAELGLGVVIGKFLAGAWRGQR